MKNFYEIFGKIVISYSEARVSFETMNTESLKWGLYVPQGLCYKWFYDYLKEKDADYNSTFYHKWEDVCSKTRLEIFLDQLKHYASTYGTNFQGEAWIPERTKELPEFPYNELKVVGGISATDAIEEVKKLAYSNIAMSDKVLDYLKSHKNLFDISQIKNRQLRLMCLDENSIFFDGQECLFWILYNFFSISMLVKNKETFDRIGSKNPEMKSALTKNAELLATVFYRNKDVFMQFKKTPELRHIVNRIRKLAKKLHKPMQKSVWLRLNELNIKERAVLFNGTPIFKLVQMYNALINPTGYYVIRNGKAFYREGIYRNVSTQIIDQLLEAIVRKVQDLGVQSVALPKGIDLAMPTSEKNFIGDIPIGSQIKCSNKNTMIGIYWKNEWGARDLDLHALTINGNSFGWNAEYHGDKGDVIYSGDMTNADPEAAEIMWFKKKPQDCIVSINKYNGSDYGFDFFVAQEKATNFHRGYMVDPRNIIFKTHMERTNAESYVTLGFFKNLPDETNFVFHSCKIGSGIVPSNIREQILNHLIKCSYLMLEDVLIMAGIEIDENAEVKLDSKGSLINFFNN